jgi:hypothetical protein
VTVTHLQRPGQARPLDDAGPAERDGALGRLVRSREKGLRIDAAACAASAPGFVGATFLDGVE